MGKNLPRCDKCEACMLAKSIKHPGNTYYCNLTGRDVGQSHFGKNSPKNCPKKSELKMKVPDQIKIIEHYGMESQLVVAMEECAELSKAVAKIYRYGKESELVIGVKEEVADVLICIKQLITMFDFSESEIEDLIKVKYERQIERMRE